MYIVYTYIICMYTHICYVYIGIRILYLYIYMYAYVHMSISTPLLGPIFNGKFGVEWNTWLNSKREQCHRPTATRRVTIPGSWIWVLFSGSDESGWAKRAQDFFWWTWLPLKHPESPTRRGGNYYLLKTPSERCTTFGFSKRIQPHMIY